MVNVCASGTCYSGVETQTAPARLLIELGMHQEHVVVHCAQLKKLQHQTKHQTQVLE